MKNVVWQAGVDPIRVLKSKYEKKFKQSDDSRSDPEEEYSQEYLKNCN